MYKKIMILSIALIISCKKEDDSVMINQDNDDVVNSINCQDVDYPNWSLSPYVLPYPTSSSYLVRLSNCNGEHTEGSSIQFAYDFQMNTGTLVTASREGVVVQVFDSGLDGGSTDNIVVVQHSDNTYAHYMHLTQNGALVESGDIVQKGDDIGLSGFSGGVTYPHLQFMVTQGNFSTSIPTSFFNTVSHLNGLAEGVFYIAEAY